MRRRPGTRSGMTWGAGHARRPGHDAAAGDWQDVSMALNDEAKALAPELSELRHSLHREPEIGLQLPKTQAKVLAALDGLPLEITPGRALTSVTAVLRGARPGATVLLRG